MKVDVYTKSLLTVIALCLLYLCRMTHLQAVEAGGQPPPQQVVIVNPGPLAVTLKDDGTLPVVIRNKEPLSVGISATGKDAIGNWYYKPLPVKTVPTQ